MPSETGEGFKYFCKNAKFESDISRRSYCPFVAHFHTLNYYRDVVGYGIIDPSGKSLRLVGLEIHYRKDT